MKLKKLLSFALALCMVLAFIPALSLTASAADLTYNGTPYNIVSSGNLIYNGDMSVTTTDDDGYIYVDGWTGGYNNSLQSLSTKTPGTYGTTDTSHFYYTESDGDTSAYITTPTSAQATNYGNGYPFNPDDACCFATINNWFVDANGAYIQAEAGKTYYMSFKMKTSGTSTSSAWVSFGAFSEAPSTYANAIPGRFDLSPFVDTAVLDAWITPAVYTSAAETWVTVEAVGTATADGYFAFQNTWAWDYGSESFTDFVLYEIEEADTAVSVTVNYTVGDETVATATGNYDSSTETGASFAEKYYYVDGGNTLYYAAADTYAQSTDVEMTALGNPDVSDYYEGYTFASSSSSTGTYKIVSDNLIPNGDFTYALNGWLGGTGAAATATANGNGTVTMSTSNTGTNGAGALYRSFAIESGKTYLYTYYANTSNSYHVASFTNTVGASSDNETNPALIGSANGGSVANTDAVGTNNFILENSSGYGYFRIQFRWSGGEIVGNFGLYEIEEADLSSYTVTRNYYLPDGTYVDSETSNAVLSGNTVSFDEVYYGPDGGNALYYTAAATYDVTGNVEEDITLAALDNNGAYASGDAITIDGTAYNVTSDNLIPNGDFAYGLEGWLGGTGAAATATANGDGTVTMSTSNTGTNGAGALYRSFAIESGKTYLYTYYANKSNSYHVASFTNTVGASSDNETNPALIGSANGGSVANTDAVGTNNFILDNSSGYGYFRIQFRWSGGEIVGNFGLYEIEEDTSAKYYDVVVALNDSDGNTVDTYTESSVLESTTTVTVPAGIYGKQYYLDADTDVDVTLENGYLVGSLTIDELSLFSWRNDAIVYSSNGEADTYNIAVNSAGWAEERTAYAYANIPEVTDSDTQTIQVTVEAYYNNGTWQAPGTITLYSTDYDSLKALDLAGGSDTTTAIEALTFSEFATLDVDLTDYDDSTRIGTFSVKLDIDTNGDVAFKLVVGGNSNGSIASVRSITFEVVTKDIGVSLVDGAQIRIGEGVDDANKITTDSGIRFIAIVDRDDTLATAADEIGIAIWDGGFGTTASYDGDPAYTIPATTYQNDAKTIFTAAIVDIDEANFNRIYVAAPYVTVNGETTYGTAVARTPYQVAAGILTSEASDADSYTYTADDTALTAVLNAYANQTGARITLYTDYSVAVATYANGATAFFTVPDAATANSDGSYSITLTASGDATFYDYAASYYRVNGASATAFAAYFSGDDVSVAFNDDYTEMTITFTPAASE